VNDETKEIDTNQRKRQIDALREMLYSAFPPVIYNGAITYSDDEYGSGPWPEELDDDEDLFKTLKGKKWTDISIDLFDQPGNLGVRKGGNLSLLTNEAYAAFLPAWLRFSLEHQGDGNLARSFFAYEFEALYGSLPAKLCLLTFAQRKVFRAFLNDTAEFENSEFVRKSAVRALENFDRVELQICK
jgi:hypothetical protein